MSNEIAPVDIGALPSTQLASDADFDELAKGGDFLGRLQLYSKGKAVDKRLIQGGNFGIPEGKDEIVDLGTSVDLLVFARRPKAIDMKDPENLIIEYDNKSDGFKRIAMEAGEKDSNCMYGVSFLCFERTTGRWLEFFCGSKSTRIEAKKIFPFLPLTAEAIAARELEDVEPHGPLPLTLESKYTEKGPYSWFTPQVKKCSTPFTKLPKTDDIIAQVTKFVNPSKEGPEKVVEPEPEQGKKKRVR